MPSGFFDHEQTRLVGSRKLYGRSFRGVSFGATGEAFGEGVLDRHVGVLKRR